MDSPAILCGWLRDWHRSQALASTNRVTASLHREEDGLACGVPLPGVPRGSLVLLQGHKAAYLGADSQVRRNSALATGCSVWAKAAKQGIPVARMPPCSCGLALPSRPHLVWQRAGTSSLRPTCAPPANRCEERLFAKVVPEMPAAPVVVGRDDTLEALSAQLDAILASGRTARVGTDGSTVSGVSAWSAAVHEGDVFAVGVSGEDQSPYRAEVEGLLGLLEAVAMCQHQGSVVVVCDCQAALLALSRARDTPAFWQGVSRMHCGLVALVAFACLFSGCRAMARWLLHDGLYLLVARWWLVLSTTGPMLLRARLLRAALLEVAASGALLLGRLPWHGGGCDQRLVRDRLLLRRSLSWFRIVAPTA